jgi:hypothetical protein
MFGKLTLDAFKHDLIQTAGVLLELLFYFIFVNGNGFGRNISPRLILSELG